MFHPQKNGSRDISLLNLQISPNSQFDTLKSIQPTIPISVLVKIKKYFCIFLIKILKDFGFESCWKNNYFEIFKSNCWNL